MNLKKFKKSVFATTVAAVMVASMLSVTAFAAPVTTPHPPETPSTGTTVEEETSPEAAFGQREYYLTEELPKDIVAINRLLDDPEYGDESYFLTITDLGAEKSFYDVTDNLTSGNGYPNQKSNDDTMITLNGGEMLRVTTYYHENDNLDLGPYVGSFFPDSLKKDEIKTIWSQVHVEDASERTDKEAVKTDWGYNVIPILAAENVTLEYVTGSLAWYSINEDLANAISIDDKYAEFFFVEDVEDLGLPTSIINEENFDHETAGFFTYKVKVVKTPSAVESATDKTKEKVNELSNSETFQKYNDYMYELGDKLGNGFGKIVDSLKN